MKRLGLVNAVVSTVMLLVLASFFMGMRLDLDGTKLVVANAGAVRWNWIFLGCAAVFVFQLLRPLLQGKFKRSGKGLVLPGFDGSTPKQKLLMLLVIVAAVAGPSSCRAAAWILPP